jgi:hypothetical protein
VVGIEEANDLMERLSTVVIPEHFRMDEGVTVAKICGKLHLWMLCVIPTNEASNKPNDDHVPDGGSSHRRMRFLKGHFLATCDSRHHKSDRGQYKNERSELPMPAVFHASSPVHRQRATGSDDAQLLLRRIRGYKGFA